MVVDKSDNEIFLVFHRRDLVAVVSCEDDADALCIGPESMSYVKYIKEP